MASGELAERLEAATAVAEAHTMLAHRTDSAEYLIAGIRDSSGLDLMPNQASRFVVTFMLLSTANTTRELTTGDAAFTHAMLGRFLPAVATITDCEALLRETSFLPPSELNQQLDLCEEMSIFAKSQGDLSSANALTETLQQLVQLFGTTLSEPANQAILKRSGAEDVHGTRSLPRDQYGTIYKPGSIRDRVTKWLFRSGDRMKNAADRVDDWNRRNLG